ncbi:DNA cytosine methyltransferase [Subtercola endophyticus]|uniref:DNA cytosine methyltransferase n=1 Tax=Subtercola endophyticus TaxID=2895559 RepID=UPI001E47C04D|nr:DNA cytosine methyltransferase [Subtercola endophyticus]UFS59492.1 DNA cytosine methyltransferase [Subtercola endophyticus]
MKPRILDLFCCAGGAGTGYARAGFEVVGVDIEPQPNYPFSFFEANAMMVLKDLYYLDKFDAIHASPPCQGYTALAAVHGNEWPKLIEPVREALDAWGGPYVIENVQGSPVRRDLTLCGEMFGLGVIRHRYFELGNWSMPAPAHVPHRGRVAGWRHGEYFDGPYVAPYGNGGGKGSVKQWQDALGIDWTSDRHELAESIPPAYTQHIGSALITQLAVAA